MHSSVALRDPAPATTGPAGLICFLEPDGTVAWVAPETRTSLVVEPSGVYRVYRYEDGFDYVVILGQLSGPAAAIVRDPSCPVEGRRHAWELIEALDGALRPGASEELVRDAR